jgi:hypothetical protein
LSFAHEFASAIAMVLDWLERAGRSLEENCSGRLRWGGAAVVAARMDRSLRRRVGLGQVRPEAFSAHNPRLPLGPRLETVAAVFAKQLEVCSDAMAPSATRRTTWSAPSSDQRRGRRDGNPRSDRRLQGSAHGGRGRRRRHPRGSSSAPTAPAAAAAARRHAGLGGAAVGSGVVVGGGGDLQHLADRFDPPPQPSETLPRRSHDERIDDARPRMTVELSLAITELRIGAGG